MPHVHMNTAWQAATSGRHFYRCLTCLAIIATDGMAFPDTVKCGACEGERWEHMGRVQRDRLVSDSMLSPCDDRCTTARGPKCDCGCGGKNHGKGWIVDWRTPDVGAVPVATPQENGDVCRKRAAEYTALVTEARETWERSRYGSLNRAKLAGQWIPEWTAYMEGQRIRREIFRAESMTSQTGRVRVLRAVIAACASPSTVEG